MAIRQKNIFQSNSSSHTSGYKLVGFATSAVNYLAIEKKSAAEESDTYYDTTLNQLRTHDGTGWSPAGMNTNSAGSLNDAASIGATITVDGSTVADDFAVTVSDGGGDVCATFTQNDITNNGKCVLLVNTGTDVTLDFHSTANTYDIQGSGNTWDIGRGGAAHFTAVAVDDDEDIELGTASNGDVRLLFSDGNVGTAGKGLLFDALGSDEQIQFGDASYSFDVWFVGADATTNFMKWDMDGGADAKGALVFDNADLDLGQSDILRFGDSQDIQMRWDGTNFDVLAAAGGSDFIFGTTAANIDVVINGDFRLDGLTASSDIQWDRSEDTLEILDEAIVAFGTDDDITFEWNNATAQFTVGAAAGDTNWYIGDTSTGFDIVYYFNGSGTITFDYDQTELVFSGSDLKLRDDDYIVLGSSGLGGGTNDGTIRWDNTNSVVEIIGNTLFEDDVQVGESGATNDLTVYGDVTITGALSHTGAYNPGSITFADNEKLNFGTDSDFVLDFDSSTGHLWLEALAADTEFSMGEATNFNLKICCGTATDYFLFDTDDSASRLDFVDTAMRFSDGTDIITFGPMASNVFPIESNTADGHAIHVGATNNIDVKIHGATATNYVLFNCDDSALDVDLDGFDIIFRDATSSVTIGPCASNVLPFNGGAANDTVSFGSTTKLDVLFEGNAYDMRWDNSRNHLLFNDAAILAFGGAASSTADYTLATAGSTNPLILVAGTANDAFQVGNGTTGTDFKWLCSGDTDAYVIFDASHDTNKGLVSIGVDDHGVDLTLFGATAGEAVAWDQSLDALTHVDGTATFSWTMEGNALQLTGDTDGRVFIMGSGDEMDVKWAAGDANTNTFVLFDASDDTGVGLVEFGQDDYGVDVKFYGATAGEMVHWDQDVDALVHSDGTQTFSWTMESTALRLTPSADDLVVEFGSGTIRTDIKWHAGDNDATACVIFDASADGSIGAVNFGVDDHGIDVIFYGATSSDALTWDQSADALIHSDQTASCSWTMESGKLRLTPSADDGGLEIGSTAIRADIKWFAGDGDTNGYVLFDASGDNSVGQVNFGLDDHGVNVVFYGATSSDALTWDQSADALVHSDQTASCSWTMESGKLRLTPSADDGGLEIGSTTIRSDIKWFAGDADATGCVTFDASDDNSVGSVSFGVSDHGIDVYFYGAAANKNLQWDQSANALLVVDDCMIALGNTAGTPDQDIVPDGTNVDWTINSGVLTIGDGGSTNYAQFAADGELTLAGTACVTKNVQLPIATGGGTVTVSAITGSPSIDWNGDGDIVYATFQVPNDWDAGSDMYIKAMVQNEIAEDANDDIEIIYTVHGISDGELNADLGQACTAALNLTGGDEAINIVNLTSATIDYNHGTYDIAAGDTVVIKGIVSLGTPTECTGPLHTLDWWIEYTASKLGTAT